MIGAKEDGESQVESLVRMADFRGHRASNGLELPDLVTIQELAVALRTSPKAIYAMVERSQLPGVVRIGRRILIRRDSIVRWLDQKSVSQGTPGARGV